jgi:hypothetical protein
MSARSRADRLSDEVDVWFKRATRRADSPEERDAVVVEYRRKVKEIGDEFDRSLAQAERVMRPYLHEYLNPPLPPIPCEGWVRYEGEVVY